MPLHSPYANPRPHAYRVNALPEEADADTADHNSTASGPTGEQHKGFISSHFGNPEQAHVFGAGNDYESEEEVKEEEKTAASQFIWYFGALVLFLLVCYWLFGYRR